MSHLLEILKSYIPSHMWPISLKSQQTLSYVYDFRNNENTSKMDHNKKRNNKFFGEVSPIYQATNNLFGDTLFFFTLWYSYT